MRYTYSFIFSLFVVSISSLHGASENPYEPLPKEQLGYILQHVRGHRANRVRSFVEEMKTVVRGTVGKSAICDMALCMGKRPLGDVEIRAGNLCYEGLYNIPVDFPKACQFFSLVIDDAQAGAYERKSAWVQRNAAFLSRRPSSMSIEDAKNNLIKRISDIQGMRDYIISPHASPEGIVLVADVLAQRASASPEIVAFATLQKAKTYFTSAMKNNLPEFTSSAFYLCECLLQNESAPSVIRSEASFYSGLIFAKEGSLYYNRTWALKRFKTAIEDPSIKQEQRSAAQFASSRIYYGYGCKVVDVSEKQRHYSKALELVHEAVPSPLSGKIEDLRIKIIQALSDLSPEGINVLSDLPPEGINLSFEDSMGPLSQGDIEELASFAQEDSHPATVEVYTESSEEEGRLKRPRHD